MKIQLFTGENQNVLSYIDTIQSNGSASATSSTDFSSALDTATSNNSSTVLDSIFQEAAETYGVDVNLLKAVAYEESGFNPNTVSSCGAVGIMQLMPSTAQNLGCIDSYDPYQNVMAGAKYLSQLLDKYDGDTSLALAAYNAGSGAVDSAGGIPYESTQRYVDNVLALYDQGVSVSGDNDLYLNNMTEAEIQSQLEKLLQAFPEHESYDDFTAYLNDQSANMTAEASAEEIANADLNGDSTLSEYEQYMLNLSRTNKAVQQLLADRKATLES